jgi:hypothetical protein
MNIPFSVTVDYNDECDVVQKVFMYVYNTVEAGNN